MRPEAEAGAREEWGTEGEGGERWARGVGHEGVSGQHGGGAKIEIHHEAGGDAIGGRSREFGGRRARREAERRVGGAGGARLCTGESEADVAVGVGSGCGSGQVARWLGGWVARWIGG
jgi:hypothetical protein